MLLALLSAFRMCAELQGKVDEFEHKAAALAKAEAAAIAGGGSNGPSPAFSK